MIIESLSIFFLIVAFWLIIVPYLDRTKNAHRTIIAVVTLVISLRYLVWRLTDTILPFNTTGVESIWIWTVYIFEILSFLELGLFLLIVSKTNNRHLEADFHENNVLTNIHNWPLVDIFIPTYNEGIDVLEKSIITASSVDYENVQVWVLDDGNRSWLKEYCDKKRVGYINRPSNEHAKAGNINYALSVTDGEFIVIMDADFCPAKNFIKRTIGFFIDDPTIGIVQTPQHFFNKDPIQANLYLDKVLPDEQRLFFDEIAPSRDGWGASFCCGSCSISRRHALDVSGGIPTQSITEDLLTTLVLLKNGYKTIYLNEKLSQGLAADSTTAYFVQRSRWCRGGIQCLFLKEGPLFSPGLSFVQRVMFLPYGWLVQSPIRLLTILVPIIYLWTGVAPLNIIDEFDIVDYLFPVILINTLSMSWLIRKKYVPIISSAIGMYSAFRMFPVVVSSLIHPFGHPFKVTPKGALSKLGHSVDWITLVIVFTLVLLTLVGVYINTLNEYSILTNTQLFPFAAAWAAMNILYLTISGLLCFDAPRKRKEERFETSNLAKIINQYGETIAATMVDLSIDGFKLKPDQQSFIHRGDIIQLDIVDVGIVDAFVTNSREYVMGQFFDLDDTTRDNLIKFCYNGTCSNQVSEFGSITEIITKLITRAFGKEFK